jgi:hypothetical protein
MPTALSWLSPATVLEIVDWPTIVATAVCLMLIFGIVIEHRRVSLLTREVQQLSRDVRDLMSAEQTRFRRELNLRNTEDRRVREGNGSGEGASSEDNSQGPKRTPGKTRARGPGS